MVASLIVLYASPDALVVTERTVQCRDIEEGVGG